MNENVLLYKEIANHSKYVHTQLHIIYTNGIEYAQFQKRRRSYQLCVDIGFLQRFN